MLFICDAEFIDAPLALLEEPEHSEFRERRVREKLMAVAVKIDRVSERESNDAKRRKKERKEAAGNGCHCWWCC